MESKYELGMELLKEVDGNAGGKVLKALADIAPDMGRYIIEFGFGEIMARPGLGLRVRELCTVAALTALGTATPQLEVHLHGALNVGCTRTEVVEAIIQMGLYAGFPAALNGLFTAKKIFAERGEAGLDG